MLRLVIVMMGERVIEEEDIKMETGNRNHSCKVIILAAILLACSIIPVRGQFSSQQSTVSYTIYGSVKDVNGNPLSYVTVTVYDTSGAFVAKTQTLLGGDFAVTLSAGTYRIQLEKKGYESRSVTVSLSRSSVNLGEIILNYALGLSISQTFMRVKALSEVSIPVSIENKGSEGEAVAVSVEAPEGWSAGIYYGSAEVINLTLSQGGVQNLNLKIRVPYNARGLYNLTVRVSGSTVQEKTVSLYVEEADLRILTSTYPIVQTTPGSTISFDITIKNVLTSRFTGTLSLEVPNGWVGSIVRGDGSIIYGLSLEPGEFVNAKVRIDVPAEEASGNYVALVYLKTKDFDSTLQLNITVVKGAPRFKLSTNTPYVDAYAGSTAKYTILIENTGNSDGVADINVTGLPSGYSWVIKDNSGNVLSKTYLKVGESKSLNLFVNIPPLAEPNVIQITLETSYEDSINRLSLGLGILGSYSISYVTQNFYCETTAGESVVFQVEVKNTGYSSISNLILGVSDIPDGFSVKVSPDLVSLLKPQESAVFSLTITSDADVSPGDYYVTLSLKADQSQATPRSLHIYVKQRGEVVLIGVLIVVIMAATTFMIYRRYGRR